MNDERDRLDETRVIEKQISEEILIDESSESTEEIYETEAEQVQQEVVKKKKLRTERMPFNDYPNYFYAGFFIRFFSFIVDSIIAGAIARILISGSMNMLFSSYYLTEQAHDALKLVITLLYFTILTYATNGQTIGKMIFGLRVVSFREERLKLSTVVTREFFGRIIHSFGPLSILYVMCAFSPKKQHLADLFADTSVVTENVLEAVNYKSANDYQ